MDASCRSVETPAFSHLSSGAETHERPVRFRETRDEPLRSDWIFFQKLAHQLESGGLVARGLGKHVERSSPLSSALTAKPHATWHLQEANLKLMDDLPVAPPDDRAGKLNIDGAGKLTFEVSIPPRSFAAVRFAN